MTINTIEEDLEYLRRHPNEIKESFSHNDITNLLLRIGAIVVVLSFIGWTIALFF